MAKLISKKEKKILNSPVPIYSSRGEELGVYDPEMIATIKNTVAVDANDSELKMFLALALQYDLDPFKKEIYFGKSDKSDKILLMISRDGYRKIVKNDKSYKNHVSDYVCENDVFKIKKINEQVHIEHEYGFDRGKLKGAYCILYTLSGESYSFFADFEKYNQSSTSLAWRNYPIDMIIKTAETRVFKSFANVHGLISEVDEDTVKSERSNNDFDDVIESEIIQEEE